MLLLFECSGDHRDLHVLTHSFPTRRSSDLIWASRAASASCSPASASFCATQASPLASNSVGQYADDSERVATEPRTAPSSGPSLSRSESNEASVRAASAMLSYAANCSPTISSEEKPSEHQHHSAHNLPYLVGKT